MCSFNILSIVNNDLKEINFHTQKRGPDKTVIKKINDITFIHNLLHITGKYKEQPFEKNNIVCVFNGEIYNYKNINKDYESDGDCIIDLYLKYDIDFSKHLDGEFAIAILDFNKNLLILSTDVFSTKPLFYCLESNNFMVSTYESCIVKNKMSNIKKLEANTVIKIKLDNFNIEDRTFVYKFDLNQHKKNYDDWNKAFINAVEKRANAEKNIFVSLSSGYDSGLICCILNNLNKKYKTYTIMGKENQDVINKRLKLHKGDHFKYNFTKKDEKKFKNLNNSNCCDFKGFPKKKPYYVLNDDASIGGSFIYKKARDEKYIINLSGQGADEIISDYGFNGKRIKKHSCFGGKFPTDLSTIFPWKSFYSGIGECLLMKEEIIGGSHGIENRYPFLDKMVVQEYLWLDSKLKNKNYKAPIYNLFKKYNYPFEENRKVGFNNLY